MVTDLYIVIAIVLIMTVATIMVRKSCAKNKQKEESEIKNSMPAGLQTFDNNGNTIVDLEDKLTFIIGSQTFTDKAEGATGSFSVSIPNNSTLFAYVYCATYTTVNLTISGNTITWKVAPEYYASSTKITFTIVYGVF